MNTADALRSRTMKDLAKLAAKLGVNGSRTMNKDELVRAVVRVSKAKAKPKSTEKPAGRAKVAAKRTKPKRTAKKPIAKKRVVKKLVAKKPIAKKPIAKKPIAKKPIANKPKIKKPIAKKPIVKTPKVKKPKVKKPVARKLVARKHTKMPSAVKHRVAIRSGGHTMSSTVATVALPPGRPKQLQRAKAKTARTVARIQKANADRERQKNLATPPASVRGNGGNGSVKRVSETVSKAKRDRVVLLVRDAYWLQAVWELTRQSVERAQAAMAEQWHTAQPTLRLIEADGGATTSTAERVAREIEVHGGVTTWYIDVPGLSKSYRVDIGYLAANGKFYSLARSNTVTTPRPNNGDIVSENWSDIVEDCEKIYALSGGYSDEASSSEVQQLFEERLGRPMGSHSGSRFGTGADKMLTRNRDFLFEVDAEMIVFGTTRPNAHVTLAGTPIKLRPDGTFTARLVMPDRRQVLPIVASSADGVEQRTVVLAVERNTKVMEPMIRESHE